MNTPGSPAVGMVCTGVRAEERMLAEAFAARNVELHVIDDRTIHGDLSSWPAGFPRVDAVLLRSKGHWRNVAIAHWLESLGAQPVNASRVLETCGDKVLTTLALLGAGVPTLSASIAFSQESGALAAEGVGYPLVVKPVIGSWGRLIGKVNDADALDLALDHKEALGGAPHSVTYLQRFVPTGGRDIRSFVVHDRCIAAIARTSAGWKTNTALGGKATGLTLDPELKRVSEAAAAAVGSGAVAVDVFETDEGYLVNEVNGTMEFRNSVATTGVDIPGFVADFVLEQFAQRAAVAR
ncbi:MAG: RimK family alpha-L-glutamate ligase [Gemmatimonadetes bacterium]|nr:RimK family alpha-L-glutamate ligase [Gemmatimonadota bacterium]MDA1102567.1 RimK family alpha-L-glutamate ligase [Gemmatimonadota bacterium]